jgi:spermidine synthase
MDQWELIDSTEVPGGGGFMRLMRRGGELVIRVDGRELMSNRVHGSEDALADLACDHLQKNKRCWDAPRILIGGMGIGFTLAATLRRVGPNAEVTVAELVPAVVDWNRGILGEAAGYPMKDPRTSVYVGDVADMIRKPPKPWDAVLLDVDNGPEGLTRTANDWLYDFEGLSAVLSALSQGGVLGVWSASPDDGFTRRIQKVGFTKVNPVRVRARGNKGGRIHIIWICTV